MFTNSTNNPFLWVRFTRCEFINLSPPPQKKIVYARFPRKFLKYFIKIYVLSRYITSLKNSLREYLGTNLYISLESKTNSRKILYLINISFRFSEHYIKVTIVKFDFFLTLTLWNISLMVSKEISFAIDHWWLIIHIHYWYIM